MKQKFLMMALGLLMMMGCTQREKLRIGFLYPSKDRLRFVKETKFFSDRIKELGAVPIVMDADDNDVRQLEMGNKLIDDESVDLLVIAAVNGNTIAPLVRKAKENDIPVVAYNMLINNVDYDALFSGDNAYLADLFCQSALTAVPKGNYVILAGDRFDRNGVELKQGIDSMLQPHIADGDIHVVFESSVEGWSREAAADEFGFVLDAYGDNIDAVLSSNDMMADGVISVLDRNNIRRPVFITGQDADIVGVRNVYNGRQNMTVYHPAKVFGYSAADLAMDILNGKSVRKKGAPTVFNGLCNIPIVKVKSVMITRDNIEKELIDTGELTWRDINVN